MIHRIASTLLLVCAAGAALFGQSPQPRNDFVQAVGQFSLALEGSSGDGGERVRASLDAMERALRQWDEVVRTYESAMAADLKAADLALATRMHLGLAGVCLDRTRTADGLRELAAARQLDRTRSDNKLEGNGRGAIQINVRRPFGILDSLAVGG